MITPAKKPIWRRKLGFQKYNTQYDSLYKQWSFYGMRKTTQHTIWLPCNSTMTGTELMENSSKGNLILDCTYNHKVSQSIEFWLTIRGLYVK
jgi:hypothetical protein